MAKHSKLGRNKRFCEKYRSEGRRIKNKIIKITRHLLKHPNDKESSKVLNKIS